MNSTPAASNARRIARSFAAVVLAAFNARVLMFSAADSLSAGLFLGEAHARAPAVLVDEVYAAGFKTSPHHVERCATRSTRPASTLAHSYNADTRLFGEVLLGPTNEGATGSALRR